MESMQKENSRDMLLSFQAGNRGICSCRCNAGSSVPNYRSLRIFREKQIPNLFVMGEDLVFLLRHIGGQSRVALQDRAGLVDEAGERIVDKAEVQTATV